MSELIGHIPHSVPQILINRDPITHANFDVCLLGNCDAIVTHLCERLNLLNNSQDWTLGGNPTLLPLAIDGNQFQRLNNSHVYLFEGANTSSKWLYQFDPLLRVGRSRGNSFSSEGGLRVPGRGRSRSRSRDSDVNSIGTQRNGGGSRSGSASSRANSVDSAVDSDVSMASAVSATTGRRKPGRPRKRPRSPEPVGGE